MLIKQKEMWPFLGKTMTRRKKHNYKEVVLKSSCFTDKNNKPMKCKYWSKNRRITKRQFNKLQKEANAKMDFRFPNQIFLL